MKRSDFLKSTLATAVGAVLGIIGTDGRGKVTKAAPVKPGASRTDNRLHVGIVPYGHLYVPTCALCGMWLSPFGSKGPQIVKSDETLFDAGDLADLDGTYRTARSAVILNKRTGKPRTGSCPGNPLVIYRIEPPAPEYKEAFPCGQPTMYDSRSAVIGPYPADVQRMVDERRDAILKALQG